MKRSTDRLEMTGHRVVFRTQETHNLSQAVHLIFSKIEQAVHLMGARRKYVSWEIVSSCKLVSAICASARLQVPTDE
jgi:hypothetical protein